MFGKRTQIALDKYITEKNAAREDSISEAILRTNVVFSCIKSKIKEIGDADSNIDFIRFLIDVYAAMDKFETELSNIINNLEKHNI